MTSFTGAVVESAVPTDVQSNSAVFASSIAENSAPQLLAEDGSRILAEDGSYILLGLDDLTAAGFPVAIGETTAATDVDFALALDSGIITEGTTGADLQSVTFAAQSLAAEAGPVVEVRTATMAGVAAIVEAGTGAALQSVTFAARSLAADATAALDAPLATMAAVAATVEAVAAGDTATGSAGYPRTISESAVASDIESVQEQFSSPVTEVLVPSDAETDRADFSTTIAEESEGQLLAEDGSRILAEDGSYLLLEWTDSSVISWQRFITEAAFANDVESVTAQFSSPRTEASVALDAPTGRADFVTTVTEESEGQLLAEDGSRILAEDGSYLLLEVNDYSTASWPRAITEAAVASELEAYSYVANTIITEVVIAVDVSSSIMLSVSGMYVADSRGETWIAEARVQTFSADTLFTNWIPDARGTSWVPSATIAP